MIQIKIYKYTRTFEVIGYKNVPSVNAFNHNGCLLNMFSATITRNTIVTH